MVRELTATYVHPTALVGEPMRPLQGMVWSEWDPPTRAPRLADPVYVGAFCIVGEGAELARGVILDAYCVVGRGATIGADTLLTYRAEVCGHASIGQRCVIGGLISEDCMIGDDCRVLGDIVHVHTNASMSWDHHDPPEPSATIRDRTFVGVNATVVGGITLGPNAYVCAGAVVTRDVPPRHVVSGVNSMVPFDEWRGPLAESPFFR